MCDYSLFAIPNRLAKEQEDLVAHRFPTGSMGLASTADLRRNAQLRRDKAGKNGLWSAITSFFTMPRIEPVPAVCIPPGARLHLQDIPVRLQQELGVGPAEDVVFTQTSASVNTYRDAVRFGNGRELNLQELREGQRVRVVSLALAEPMAAQVEEEPHALLYRVRSSRSHHLFQPAGAESGWRSSRHWIILDMCARPPVPFRFCASSPRLAPP